MSAVTVNDRFAQLIKEKEPAIFDKIKTTQYGVMQLNNGEYKAYFTPGSLTDNDKEKIQALFTQALQEESKENKN